MKGKLKLSGKSSFAPKVATKAAEQGVTEAAAPVTPRSMPVATHGKGGVYRSLGGGRRVRL